MEPTTLEFDNGDTETRVPALNETTTTTDYSITETTRSYMKRSKRCSMVFTIGNNEHVAPEDVMAAALNFAPSTEPLRAQLIVPAFEIRSKIDVKAKVLKLEAPTSCTDQADFSGVAGGLGIDDAAQEAFVKITTSGFEAAAVTAVAMSRLGFFQHPEAFVFDRPFAFVITDNATGLPLFTGWVADPTA